MAMMQRQSFCGKKKLAVLLVEPLIQVQLQPGITTAPETHTNVDISSLDDVRSLCKQGRLMEALSVLDIADKPPLDSSTYVCLLQGCIQKKAALEGKRVHSHMKERKFSGDRFLRNTLLNMYTQCGTVVDAHRVFDQMTDRDVFSWTVMIAAYTRQGFPEEALILFYQMQRTGLQANHFTFAAVILACTHLASLEKGMEIHEEVRKTGFQCNIVVGNSLIDMYAKCGSMKNASEVFETMRQRNIVSWTAMISGYARIGLFDDALKLFKEMSHRDVVAWTAMITAYVQNGFVDKALELFNEMPQKNAISWNAMIAGFAQNGCAEEALKFFRQMQLAGERAGSKTFASTLPACANLSALEQGMEIHGKIIACGFQRDVFVTTALVDIYAQCGSIQEACDLFNKMHHRDLFSWNAMITGCAQNGLVSEALKLFKEMPQRNIVSWNSMIAAFAKYGRGHETLLLFKQMQLEGVKPDSKTFASILPVCANLAALEHGMEIHERIVRSGFLSEIMVLTSLIDMYAKCGSIRNARELFDKMDNPDLVSWNTMLTAYAMHGCGKEALKLFEEMKQSGINPDHCTFLNVLSACSHAGLVDEGFQHFNGMKEYYHVTPAIEHYICIVDLLSRAGHLDEAQAFISKMPIEPDAVLWSCLLGACRIHHNIELGEFVAQRAIELDPKNPSPYVLLSNIYAAAGQWDDREKVRKMMEERGVKKMPGCSWIEVNKQVHYFMVGDKSHPQMQEIYTMLDRLSSEMNAAGYVPDTRIVLNDVRGGATNSLQS